MLSRLYRTDFEQIFEIMERSFPKDEYRTYEGQKTLFDEDVYSVYGLIGKDSREIQGFITIWEYDEVAFVEHLAVNPLYRNKGLGSQILKEAAQMLNKMLCLEVELPETEIAARRIGFYKRNGYFLNEYPYIQPALAKGQDPVPLLIMTTEKALSEEEFENIKMLLYKNVYKVK